MGLAGPGISCVHCENYAAWFILVQPMTYRITLCHTSYNVYRGRNVYYCSASLVQLVDGFGQRYLIQVGLVLEANQLHSSHHCDQDKRTGCVFRLHCSWAVQNPWSTNHLVSEITIHYVTKMSSAPCLAQTDPPQKCRFIFLPSPSLSSCPLVALCLVVSCVMALPGWDSNVRRGRCWDRSTAMSMRVAIPPTTASE